MISFVVFRKTDNSIRFAITTDNKKYQYTPKGTGRKLSPGQVLKTECDFLGRPKISRGDYYRISYYKDNLLGVGFVSFVYLRLLYLLRLIK